MKSQPCKVAPRTFRLRDAAKAFTLTFPPSSLTVLRLEADP